MDNKEVTKKSQVELKITDNDIERFFEAVMNDEPYMETIPINNGKMNMTFRNRTVGETNKILEKMSKEESKTTAEFELKLALFNCAFSLVKIASSKGLEEFDKGSIDERAERLRNMQSIKYMIIIDSMFAFEAKCNKLRQELIKENF